jgi:hypothetical protein
MIKMDLKDMRRECMDLNHLAQNRAQWWEFVKTGNEPSGAMKDG